MKNPIYFSILVLITSLKLQAQDAGESPSAKNVFYFSPIHLLASQFRMAYERNVGKKANSIMVVGGLILGKSSSFSKNGGAGELHYRASVIYKKISGATIRVFAGPFVKGKYLERTSYYSYDSLNYLSYNDTVTNYISSYSGGMVAGFELSLIDKISFNVYIGGGAQYSDIIGRKDKNQDDMVFQPGYTGIIPEGGILIGVRF